MDLKISFKQLDGYGMVLIRLVDAIYHKDYEAIRVCVKQIDKKAVENKKSDKTKTISPDNQAAR